MDEGRVAAVSRSRGAPSLAPIKGFILDMDGVLYRGNTVREGTIDFIEYHEFQVSDDKGAALHEIEYATRSTHDKMRFAAKLMQLSRNFLTAVDGNNVQP